MDDQPQAAYVDPRPRCRCGQLSRTGAINSECIDCYREGAVLIAARAWFDRQQAARMDAGRKRPDGQRWRWEDITDSDKRAYLALVEPIVKAILEA